MATDGLPLIDTDPVGIESVPPGGTRVERLDVEAAVVGRVRHLERVIEREQALRVTGRLERSGWDPVHPGAGLDVEDVQVQVPVLTEVCDVGVWIDPGGG